MHCGVTNCIIVSYETSYSDFIITIILMHFHIIFEDKIAFKKYINIQWISFVGYIYDFSLCVQDSDT